MLKYRIMVIDDDEDARRLIAMTLEPQYEVVVACDGLDALSKLEAAEPDFAIIDIMMPLMDGYQVCEAIRRNPRFKSMQVMFLSAHGDKENIKKSYAAGANLFLTKPVDPARILKNIECTVAHEPPPLRAKRYSIEQLAKMTPGETPEPEARDESAESLRPAPAAPGDTPAKPPSASIHPELRTVPPAQPASAQPRPRILIVDDDAEMLKMLELTLRDEYEVTKASNGLEAIERMVEVTPDLLIVDVMMPKMNGYQLLQSVRRNVYFADLPVIILSAKSSARDLEYAARLGATLCLPKPYNVEDLLAKLAGITQSPGFKIHPKRMSLFEINQRDYAEHKSRIARKEEREAQRRMALIQDLSESEKNKDPRKK